LRVRDATIDGTILGSTSRLVPIPFDDWQHFDLPAPVALVPGETYVIQVEATESILWSNSGDLYPGGMGIFFGDPSAGQDLLFRTYGQDGSPTPTPSPTPAPVPPTPTPVPPTPAPTPPAGDADGDGVSDADEEKFGSNVLDATSTPEDADYDSDTCTDGVDNDGDGNIDAADSACGPAGLPGAGAEPSAGAGIPWLQIAAGLIVLAFGGLVLVRQIRRTP
jgi:hypothetical protein